MPSPIPRAELTSDQSADETTAHDEQPADPDDRIARPAMASRPPARRRERPGEGAATASSGPGATLPVLEESEPPEIHRLGRYCVEGRIGKGGFGQVFLARDDELKRMVAIKLADRLMFDDADISEARIVAGLDHPHIVPVFDIGRTDAGRLFIVTKLIDGRDLAARLRERRLPLEQAVDLVRMIAMGLHHAHENGLVHRDVKPGNILLDKCGPALCLRLRAGPAGRGPVAGIGDRRHARLHEPRAGAGRGASR